MDHLAGFARWMRYAMMLSVMFGAGCAEDSPVLALPNPDLMIFQETAYPLLLRDCGFPACHGDARRFFRVFGPGRTRLVPTMAADEPLTAEEITESYARTISMLITDENLSDSWLLRKPLDTTAGGSAHKGADAWGRNVYYSRSDPSYAKLVNWAYTEATNAESVP
jgi:hypothetical protein